jgi:signal transduction histidine kinase/HAMP domain-containing protein
VRQDKEQTIFHVVLWAFLLGSLIFLIARLSSGRLFIPATIWYMLLLLDVGFIVFTFVPHAGRGLPGVPGRHEETVERHRWYPRHLAEIVDGRGGETPAPPEGGVYPPPRAVPPVPLVPLVLLGACLALAYSGAPNEAQWRTKEAVRLRGVYEKAAGELARLEGLAVSIGSTAAARIDWNAVARGDNADRSDLIRTADSLAKSVDLGEVPFREVGVQVLSRSGDRVAWGGSPRYLPREWGGEPSGTLVFTSRAPLYTLLVCEVRDPARGSVVIDIPLEVNYRINNRFLRSTSLGEVLTRRYGDEVEFGFSMGEHRGVIGWNDPGLAKKDVRILYGPNVGVQVVGIVQTSTGVPLARLKVLGDPYAAVLRESEARRAKWAGLLISIAVIVVVVWLFRSAFRRGGARRLAFPMRVAGLAAALVAIRLLLIRLNIPGGLIGTPVFSPTLFADSFPGGVMRSAGDFLVSAVFALIFVFGSIKAFRTYYGGRLERSLDAHGSFSAARLVAKAAILFGALEGAAALSTNVVSRATINALPRLVGLDVNLAGVPVLVMHLSLLFTVSAIFIAALFAARLALVWGGKRLVEGLAASALALAGFAALHTGHVGIVVASAGLLVLSFRIFPLLKKEEAVSVVFASFFLVLLSSLVVYVVASERYADLRKGYILDKIREFNRPEDNWVQVYLPDICAEISNDQSMSARVVSRDAAVAFEMWAESSLSRSGLSCDFEVFDAAGALLSRFAVGMPIEIPREPPDRTRFGMGPFVESARAETRSGAVYYYEGYAPIFHPRGDLLGWVEITIPYFFENPELLARTGRMAPEILQNFDPGGERRRDMPDKLLVARVSGTTVTASSESGLRPGTVLRAAPGSWFTLVVAKEAYNCFIGLGPDDAGYLVGYRVAGRMENLLQWATIVSLDVILTLVSLLLLFVLKRLPVLRGVMPDVSPVRGPGFRQKVMLSFLVVSILPVVILGVFSSQLIARRYRAEEENRALLRAQAAVSLIEHSIRTEAASLAGGQYISELLAGEKIEGAPLEAGIDTRRFTLIGSDGEVIFGGAAAGITGAQLEDLLAGANTERVVVSYESPVLYGGVVVPIETRAGRGGYLYYRRALDDAFVKSVSTALGTDINIYYDALVRATSERELFLGGFLDPLCRPSAFVSIALEGGAAAVLRETLGDYSYYVASAPLAALGGGQSAVLSVPMLYLPILMQEEVRRTSMLVLGLLALLFAATVTLGVFLAGKIFNPIAALQDGTRKIIDGELEFRLEARAPDEIGELVESFNTMTAALREARRGLLERQRYLAAVLDNIATGVLATGRDGAIITLNPSGERILRVSASAIVGERPDEAFGEGLAPLRDLFAAPTGEVREVELSLFSCEMARTVKAVVAGLEEGGERLGTVLVFDDLTELIRSKKLSAWVEMARQIAHEVKNPLTPIKLSAQLMKKAHDSGSEDFDGIFRSGVDTVIQQTEILRRIATEFSSFGKAMRLNPEPVPLEAFLGEIVSYYRGAEKVSVKLACEDPVTVRADREALRKIFVNLIENAIDAMPDGGEVAVSCRRDGQTAVVGVVDSGKGLSSEMQARLFEPYFSTKTNGIGLGLAISQNLARAMDGEIRLRNREGAEGVEATVTLPLA